MSEKQEPWEVEGFPYNTKAKFFSWLRGQLRRSWTRWPIKNSFKRSMCRKAKPGSRAKTEGQCVFCGKWFAASKLEVDHIESAGSLNSWDDIAIFTQKLLCTRDNMQLTCKPCHKIRTLSDRKGISIDQARVESEIIKILKSTPAQELKEMLINEGIDPEDVTNHTKRKKAVREVVERRLSD